MGYRTNLTAEVASSAGLGRERLLQLRVLGFGYKDGDVGVLATHQRFGITQVRKNGIG
jgi:hypothetical protein